MAEQLHASESTAGADAPRVRVASGDVDGAWWPVSRDLVAELPRLLASLSDNVGRVVGVGYRREDWDSDAPAEVPVDDYTVDLLGFDEADVASVVVIDRDGNHLNLRLIAAETTAAEAQRELEAIAEAASRSSAVAGQAHSMVDVASRLAKQAGITDETRKAEILQWCGEAAAQFRTARIQSFVPILVEHIVFQRIFPNGPDRLEDAPNIEEMLAQD